MTCIKTTTTQPKLRDVHVVLTRCLLPVIFLALSLISRPALAQNESEYDEIGVYLDVPRLGGGEVISVIKGGEVFLPVTDLFDFLRIKNTASTDMDTISGFFINQAATYLIDRSNNSIKYQGKVFNLDPGDLIRTESNLYLRSVYFGKIFGLECSFNFRNLTVVLNSKMELPMIREMRLEEMRRNINRLKGEQVADTTIARSHPIAKAGMADWAINTTEEINGKADARINLALGSMLAGGEASALLVYNSLGQFNEKQQNYLWRYVNNDFSPLRQVMAGKIATHATSSIYGPVIGMQITNTPTTYRQSFGSYTLSDKTDPGWIVELYVNNVLVDYVKADASGFYTLEVPLVYGSSTVNLKFYGPWGEERTREQNINIPFNFLPVKTVEYNIGAGFVEDSLWSRFSRVNVNYGATRGITIGAGVEYLSSVISTPAMPFFNASLRITNNLLLSGEYTYGVKSKATLTYRLPSNLQFDINYSLYDKDQKAISLNYREERKAVVSMPVIIAKLSTFQRLSLYQIVLPQFKYTTGEWLFSSSFFGVSTNLTTIALFTDLNKPYVYSNLSMAMRLPAGFVLMPQLQYRYTQAKLLSIKLRMEKHLSENAFLNVSYEQMFLNNLKMAEVGFRYDFSFAQTGASVRQSNNKTTFVQYARGSLIADRKTKYFRADNRTNVNRGGITIIPFLDLNANGKKDQGEPKAFGLNLHANGGQMEKNERDSTIRIVGLEPYTSCFIELDPNSFENITWRLKNKSFNVVVDPNILKTIEVPITIAGEASGTVTINKDGVLSGKGRIAVDFFTSGQKPAGNVITEEDGYFSYLGLSPGNYIVRIDSGQLRKLGLVSNPEFLPVKIRGTLAGDIVEGLDFTLMLKAEDTVKVEVVKEDTIKKPIIPAQITLPVTPEKSVVKKDTSYMIIHQVTKELVTTDKDSYDLQLGAFKMKANADKFRKQLQNLLGKTAEIVTEGDFFKVRITGLKDQKEVDETIAVLRQNGVIELWVISLKAKQQQWVITNKRDSVTQIKETVIEKPVKTYSPTIAVQVGAFKQGAKAIELRKRLSATTSKQVDIVPEDGYFKVRISGFTSKAEMEKITSSLGLIGSGKVWTLPQEKQNERISLLQPPFAEQPAVADIAQEVAEVKTEIPIVIKPDTTQKVAEEKIEIPLITLADTTQKPLEVKVEIPLIVKPDTTQKVAEEKIEVPVVEQADTSLIIAEEKAVVPAAIEKLRPAEPMISLQVGVIYKHSEALRVQKKIKSKLKVPVEVVKQWDYYRVVITGFYTREETYRFYPELVGLGYQKIFLIEKK